MSLQQYVCQFPYPIPGSCRDISSWVSAQEDSDSLFCQSVSSMWGELFTLGPQFSERFQKSCWFCFFLERSAFLCIRMKEGASKFLKFWPRKHVSYHLLLFFTKLILFLFKKYLPTWSLEKCVSLCAFLVIIIHFLILFWKESCYIEERDLRKGSTLGGRMIGPAPADSWEPTVKSLFCSVFSDILLVAWDQPQG